LTARPQPQAGQASVKEGGVAESTTSAASVGGARVEGMDNRSIDELIKFIEGHEPQQGKKKRPPTQHPRRRGGKK